MPLAQGVRFDLKRARKIVKAVNETGYDIICLQEVFDEDARAVFVKGFKKTHPHQVRKCHGGGIFRENSGLFVASRYPIKSNGEDWYFEEFEDSAGADVLSEKGILAVHLDLEKYQTGLSLVVFNVHLQSDSEWTGENEDVRNGQLKQIRKFLGKSLSRVNKSALGKMGALLAGDMNIEGDKLEWTRLFRILEYPRDLFRMKNKNDRGYTWDYETNTNPDMIPHSDKDQLRLDYIFALDFVPVEWSDEPFSLRKVECTSAQVQLFETGKKTRLSDHYAVEASIRI